MNIDQALDDFLFHDSCKYCMKPSDWPEIALWCEKTFGPGNWQYFRGTFSFHKAGCASIFLLRWL